MLLQRQKILETDDSGRVGSRAREALQKWIYLRSCCIHEREESQGLVSSSSQCRLSEEGSEGARCLRTRGREDNEAEGEKGREEDEKRVSESAVAFIGYKSVGEERVMLYKDAQCYRDSAAVAGRRDEMR